LAGFRLNLYRLHGRRHVLEEPLKQNRTSRATLDAMWETVDRNKAILGECLRRKAQLLGVDRLHVYDLWAPLGVAGRKVTYEAAAEAVVANFGRFSPDMGQFARKAFADRWIEAENRPNKRPGGFCTPFPYSRQSRILSTFDGSPVRAGIIAHELGHAYHDHALAGMPHVLARYPETLGIFGRLP
jgi:oligoendopeptidase F